MELDRSKHSGTTGGQETVAVKAVPETFEARLTRVFSGIRKDYQGILYEDPRAKALVDITTLTGLYLIGEGMPIMIQRRIITRRSEGDEAYKKASTRLDELTATCLGDKDNVLAEATALKDQLHAVVNELWPEHGQHIATRAHQTRRPVWQS